MNEMNGEKQYLELLEKTLSNGIRKSNRTGVDTIVHPYPVMIQHDMSLGFPLLTTKQVSFKQIRVELEGFIRGIMIKSWYQKRGCTIWDEWCNPQKVPYGNDEDTKRKMLETNDLGKIYGYQWRNFNGQGYDQLKKIIDTLRTNPDDRRMLCVAWNPNHLDQQALPPCHWAFEIQHINGTLNLMWHQRSCDGPLGCPYNLASYSLLLHLICKETRMKEGIVTGVFNDFHIYENQIEGVNEQLSRDPDKYKFCKIETPNFTNIFDWDYTLTKSVGYKDNHYPKISMPVAV
jgi:thymidylate synthase